ncbi:hypothetical protein SERLA73DRAFT_175234 [Serpula lacrymans var. lacrymans S7.3]|uniref:Uncharacterized protein n=2 Tax=Serpula lacrymans var. lacrymans TaxID=341189 RepID=F8PIN7_SERL3|nr:uncharacterized protein SERLADRAFT_457395 [Serpula lacrymans var. lacrymans S7.9]EGO03670.1 hypothetical protein SERLA73DRAFT_175234 [Serpula lacrymans var. lacrymans S7.3]EGO29533.1 hypothetical protein SERLADRAFT_457395 [Serpula lacrymans var. lacrymans S7.9]
MPNDAEAKSTSVEPYQKRFRAICIGSTGFIIPSDVLSFLQQNHKPTRISKIYKD